MIFLVLAVVLLFYLPALKYHYVVDDLGILSKTEQENTPKPKNFFMYLWRLYQGWGYWGEVNQIAHAMPIAIHLAVVFLIWFVFGMNNISLLAAALFAIHPCNTEISVWLSGKSYGVTTALVLLAWGFPFLAPAVFLFAPNYLFFTAIFSPLAFLWRGDLWAVCAVLVVWQLYSRYKYIFGKGKENVKLHAYRKNAFVLKFSPWKLVIAIKFYGFYLVNNILGLHYSFYQSYMDDFIDTKEGIEKSHEFDWYFFVGLAAAYILVTNMIWNLNLAVFGLFWATLHIAQWCNLVTIGQQYASNRQAYLPNVGLCLMLAVLLQPYPWAWGLILGWYARQLIPAIRQYRNTYWHFFYQIADHPDFYYSWINMGNHHFHNGMFSTAIGDYMQALEFRPNNFKALWNLSSAYLARGNIVEAIKYFELSRKADVYAQEEVRENMVVERMKLITRFVQAKGAIKLKMEEIPVVA